MLDQKQLPYVLAGVFLMTLQPVLVTMSQNADKQIEYSATGTTMLSELLKLGISIILFKQYTPASGSCMIFSTKFMYESIEYAVPGMIYFVNNNLVFVILSAVDATSFQLLSQLKVVFTGLLFRFFLSRELTAFQYLAIWQLTCGSAIGQLPKCVIFDGTVVDDGSYLMGVFLSVVSCLLSAFGGIYSEKLLKDKPKESLHLQNIQLYTWGVAFNLLGMLMQGGVSLVWPGLFAGYNKWTYMVLLNNALNGLAISAILKYADNIARVYAHTLSMLATMVVSVVLFGTSPTPQLMLSIAIVGASAVQYNIKPDAIPATKKVEHEEHDRPITPSSPKSAGYHAGEEKTVDTQNASSAAESRGRAAEQSKGM